MELSALERLKNIPIYSIYLQRGKRRIHCFLVVFDLILLILAGNENMH